MKQIHRSAVGVDVTNCGIKSHGVHRKVPPCQIVTHVVHKFHPVGMAAVCIAAFGAVGGDLVQALVNDHAHSAVLFPVSYQLVAVKDLGDLIRLCVGAKVVILGGEPQHPVSHTAAHGVGGVAGAFQHFNKLLHRPGQNHFTGRNKKGAQKPKGQTDKIKNMPVGGGSNGTKQGGLPPHKACAVVCFLTGGAGEPMNAVNGGKQVKQAVKKIVLGLIELCPQCQVAQHHAKAHKNGQKHIQKGGLFACKIGGSQPPKAEKTHCLRHQQQGAAFCFKKHIGTGQCTESGTDAGNGKLRDDLIRPLRACKAVYDQQDRKKGGDPVQNGVIGVVQGDHPQFVALRVHIHFVA